MVGQWPFVGRAGELRRLQAIKPGSAPAIVLAGSAGVGKTRLALEYVSHLERSDTAVVRITATSASRSLPLGAFGPLLPAVHHGETAGVDDRADLLRQCGAFLMSGAAGRSLVLFVDDAHLLDDLSATLVQQMAMTGSALVVATLRSGEPAPAPIVALWKDDAVERVDVAGLKADFLEELLLAVLGGPVDRAVVHRLVVQSQGNVLFFRELVLGALEDGTLCNDVGIWRFVGPLSPSARLGELVEARLAGLSPVERNLLEVVSIGEPMGTAELVALGEPALAEALERRGLLSSRSNGRRLELTLGHSLYGEVIRKRMPALRLREVARLLADAVEASGARRREDVLRLATWRLEGGPTPPRLMYEAATLARWRYDFPLAERLAHAAVRSGAGFEASLLAAQLASLQGRGAEAETALAALAQEATDDGQRGVVACARVDNFVSHMGNMDAGLRVAEEAERAIADPAWRDELVAKRAGVVDGQHGPRAAAALAEPLLDRASGRAFLWASIMSSHSNSRMGRLERACQIAERAYEAHLALAEPFDWYPWIHMFIRNEALIHGGRVDEAFDLATEHYRQGLEDNSPEAQAFFAWQLAEAVPERGFPRTAAVHGRTAAALFQRLGRPQFESFVMGPLAVAEALSGNAAAAAGALRRIDDALHLPPARYYAVDLLVARAWTAAAAGNLSSANQVLKDAIRLGGEIGDVVGEAAAWHTLARLGRADEAVDGLERLARQAEGDLIPARAAHVTALAATDEDALARVSDRFETMGVILLAAEAAADAAVAWRRRGDSRRAARAEQRARTLAAQCEDPSTPALQALRGRSRVTRAERETALLAITGLSNRRIAQELQLSVRTVENHLQHVYEKLGISGRAELAEALEKGF